VYHNVPTEESYPVTTHFGSAEPGLMAHDDVRRSNPGLLSKNGLP